PLTLIAISYADPTAKGSGTINLIGSGAKFVGEDSTTSGSWKGLYGSEGWALAASPSNIVSLPPYLAAVDLSSLTVFTFADLTTAPRGLKNPPTFATLFAAAWANNNALKLNSLSADYNPHGLFISCVDWAAGGRVQNFETLDASQPPPAYLAGH